MNQLTAHFSTSDFSPVRMENSPWACSGSISGCYVLAVSLSEGGLREIQKSREGREERDEC